MVAVVVAEVVDNRGDVVEVAFVLVMVVADGPVVPGSVGVVCVVVMPTAGVVFVRTGTSVVVELVDGMRIVVLVAIVVGVDVVVLDKFAVAAAIVVVVMADSLVVAADTDVVVASVEGVLVAAGETVVADFVVLGGLAD